MTMKTLELSIANAMTARDLNAHQIEMERRLGKNSHVGLATGAFSRQGPAFASFYPDGVGGTSRPEYVHGVSWSDVIPAAYAWIENYKIVHRDTTIRRMALAIIELTDEHTRCTAAMLERKKFDAVTIQEFHKAACYRAAEMAGNIPFIVEFEG